MGYVIKWFLLPVIPVQDTLKQRNIKLLSAILLLFISSCSLFSSIQLLTEEAFSTTFYWLNISNVVLLGAYLLNRRGRLYRATVLSVGWLSVSVLVAATLGPGNDNTHFFFGMVMPVLLGSMLLSVKGTMLLAGAGLGGMVLTVFLSPKVTFAGAAGPIGFFITMSLLLLMFIRHRNNTESDRQLKLLDQEERYRTLVENINETIYAMDTNGYFTYVSPAAERMTHFVAKQLIGQHFSRFVHPEDWPAVEENLRLTYSGKSEPIDFRFIDKNQQVLHVSSSAQPVQEDGEPTGLTGVITNISEHKRLEDQLHQAQKMESVGRLAGGIAHDFNNLLTVIKGYCEMLGADEGADPGSRGMVKGIRTATERAAVLTQQLLAFSRRQIVEPLVLDLNNQVANIEKMLGRIIGENITLETRTASSARNIKLDPSQLEQVIMNLTVNAVDAMPQGGKLTIQTANAYLDEDYCRRYSDTRPGHYVMLSISDTGCGMNEKTAESVFEPFFTTKEAGKGTGLGLSTVYGIVKQNGGHIWFQSEVGKGTVFRLYFPAASEKVEEYLPAVTDTSIINLDDVRGAETLMVVEDEEGLREVVVQSLQEYGYTVYAAPNGPDALELCGRESIGRLDLLITDVVMPGMNGKELADQMAKRFPDISVLFISGYAQKAILNQGIRLEGATILAKPFSPKALVKKIRQILHSKT